MSDDKMRVGRVQVYLNSDGWRFRVRAVNGETIGPPGEAYADKADCIRAAEALVPEGTPLQEVPAP